MHARERPSRLTANADAGWRRLRWRSWGGETAVARGAFTARRWIPIGHTDVVRRTFSYPVKVTLSRIQICGDRAHYYTRIQTRFLSAVPREVRRQAKPLGTSVVPQSPAGWVTREAVRGARSIVQREPVRDRALVSKRMPARPCRRGSAFA